MRIDLEIDGDVLRVSSGPDGPTEQHQNVVVIRDGRTIVEIGTLAKQPQVSPNAVYRVLRPFDAASFDPVMEARGVSFLDYTEGPLITTGHIAQLGPARGAWFRDPDGNTLGLRQG